MTQTTESYTPSPVLVAEGESLRTLRLERDSDNYLEIVLDGRGLGAVSPDGQLSVTCPELFTEGGALAVDTEDSDYWGGFLASARRGQAWAQKLIERGCEDLLIELCEAMNNRNPWPTGSHSAADLGFPAGAAAEVEERARAARRAAKAEAAPADEPAPELVTV